MPPVLYSSNSPATRINDGVGTIRTFHTYLTAGVFTATLTVTDDGRASESVPITVGVTPLPTLDVTVDTDTVKPGGFVVFTPHFTAGAGSGSDHWYVVESGGQVSAAGTGDPQSSTVQISGSAGDTAPVIFDYSSQNGDVEEIINIHITG